MAMGRQKAGQGDLMVSWSEMPRSPGHVFYDRLQSVLIEGGFDAFAEASCRPYYAARMGAPSVPPGRYFRMHLVGYFEGIDSERGLEWRCSDSLSLRAFLRLGSRDRVPDHSWLSRSRTRLPHEVHAAVFDWVLVLIAEAGLIKGERIGVDASTMEANAALRNIVRRDNGEGYREMLERLARESGVETRTAEDLARLDRKRKGKKLSNTDWVSKSDPEAKIAKMTRRTAARIGAPVATLMTRFSLHGTRQSTRLGARPPDNIVVGLEPNFFATSADVRAIGSPHVLRGQTLFVSSSLARLFSLDEMSAVIGHELGHFRGDDTVYSLKFAPVYAGLGKAIGVMQTDGEEGVSGLAKIPALALLSLMFEIFSRSEATVGRERELAADRAGTEVSSAISLATALMKVALYSSFWADIRQANVDRLNEGKISRNLSKVFANCVKFDVDKMTIEAIIDQVVESSIFHPTDTHPTIAERMKSLGVASSEIRREEVGVPDESAVGLIGDADSLDEDLTVLEHQLMVAIGRARLPDEEELEHDYLLRIMYSLAAAMVGADGKILPEEIHVAEEVGKQLFDDSDPIEFRESCENFDDLPSATALVSVLTEMLDNNQKRAIVSYLAAISKADDDVAPEEEALLKEVSEGLGVRSE